MSESAGPPAREFAVVNETRGTVVATRARPALRLTERLKGLIGRKCLGEGEALAIPRCSNVHTFFMAFPIDVVFLDGELKVKRVASLAPFRLSPLVPGSRWALELPAGTLEASGTEAGDRLSFIRLGE